MSATSAKRFKSVVPESPGVDPEQEMLVLKYLLSVNEVQTSIECGKSGDETRGRKVLLATILNLVHHIVNSKAKGAPQAEQQGAASSQVTGAATGAPTVSSEAVFTQIVRHYITNHARLGRKAAFKELLNMLTLTPINFPESVTRQLVNIGLSAEEAVRPCSDLLADLVCAGAMSPHILVGLIPAFAANLKDVATLNPRAPDLFVFVVSEVAKNAPADKVSFESIILLAKALGNDQLPHFARLVNGNVRLWAVEALAKSRNVSVQEIERLLNQNPF